MTETVKGPEVQPIWSSGNHPSPEEIVARVIATVRNSDGSPQIGRATRKKAHEVVAALRAAGWRILR